MNALLRYLRAFGTALRLTLRGETPTPSPQAALVAWMKQTATLADQAIATAEAEGFDQEARRRHTLTAEGRRISMETILASIRFHAAEEYPHLIATPSHTATAAIYATNLNDRFLAARLFDTLESAVLREVVGKLVSHLEAIPSSIARDQ